MNVRRESNGGHAPTLYYFADPMCSWCWGFSPIIESIVTRYRDRLAVALVVGGLRPDETETLTAEARADILHHWEDVHRMTRQPFSFEGALPDGFAYNTEPPSRAALTVGQLRPDALMGYFRRLHEAFYVERRDITKVGTLKDLVVDFDITPSVFEACFQSEYLRDKTRKHFAFARRLGVTGFPTTVLVHADSSKLLSGGYQPLRQLVPEIDGWLTGGPDQARQTA